MTRSSGNLPPIVPEVAVSEPILLSGGALSINWHGSADRERCYEAWRGATIAYALNEAPPNLVIGGAVHLYSITSGWGRFRTGKKVVLWLTSFDWTCTFKL